MNRLTTGMLVFAAIALMGCGDATTPEGAAQHQKSEIEWFAGDVEEAFTFAKETGKPVFLYWGAEWCPPCHNLKKNIFSKAEFVEASRRFVPVYLDGDTERAQIWGEEFAIAGYPTVILFSPTGIELYRMPTDVTAEQYGILLEAAVADFEPVDEILTRLAETGPVGADELDLELVAYHSWSQDRSVGLDRAELTTIFWRLFDETTAEADRLRARFMTLAVGHAVPQIGVVREIYGEAEIGQLDEAQREALREELMALLGDPGLWPENKIFLTLQSRSAVDLLEPEPTAGRDELVQAWVTAAVGMQEHPEFSATEQLMAFVPEFELLSFQGHTEGEVVPDALREKVRTRAESVVADPGDPGEFQSTLNMVVWLMQMAGFDEEAKVLLDEHLDKTVAPHYFLSLLGDLNADDPEVALDWYRQAFEQAGTGSSGIKWGTTYVLRLIQLAPDDANAIDAAAQRLVTLMVANEDAFAGRNFVYLGQLETALTSWAEETDNQAVLDGLRTTISDECSRFEADLDPDQVDRCLAFLADS